MIIEPNAEGWSFSDELTDGREALVYEGLSIVYRGTQTISTTSTLFVGTPEEIDAHIAASGVNIEPTTTDE